MARPKTVPDQQVFLALRHVLATEGEKAVSFSRIGRDSGLAPASLVQRYGNLGGMIHAALSAAWDMAEAETAQAAATNDTAHGFLKALGSGAEATDPALLAMDFRDAALRVRAEAWRSRVEAVLTERLGDAESAALLFAAWQGQLLWQSAGGKGFRLKAAAKRLG